MEEQQQQEFNEHLNKIAEILETLAQGPSISLDMQFAYRHAARVVRA